MNLDQSENSGIDVGAIWADAEALLSAGPVTDRGLDPETGLFRIQPASKWLEESGKRPAPRMLFGELWFEGEICILFADTNVGKSILAVQIADAISRGIPVEGLALGTQPQKVIYFDFELSDKQFEARYSEKPIGSDFFENPYEFNPNFLRAEINPEAGFDENVESFETYLYVSLTEAIVSHNAKVLIIDNLTYLKNETERARDALPLMKQLKALKARYGLSILALAHTPKRDHTKPIGRNDLQGSKMLVNFCDSCFAIGESAKESGLRYLKQIKVRNAEVRFDSDNVFLCQVAKPDNFLRFEFIGFGNERDHLKQLSTGDRDELIVQAKEMSASGYTQREIGDRLGISAMTVGRYLKRTES